MTHPGTKPFVCERERERGLGLYYPWYETNSFCSSEHYGTHLDSPSHFAEGKWTVDQIPLTHLMGPGVVIDIQAKVEEDPNAELTTDDLMEWLGEHGPLPDGVILLLRTGWGTRFGNRTAYYGTDGNDTSKLAFPGFSPGAAQLLVGYEAATGRRVFGVGLDTPSLDYGPSTLFTSHVEFSSANIFGLENVANLKKLPTTGFHLTVMPMKIKGGSGAPARIIATLPEVRSASIPTQRDSSATSLITKASLHYYMGVILLLLQGCI
ncbi:isatin hydrolase-like isoform X2 [Homarus americanus]|uniref:isatin hydrolase-like isoform X2 n=1 Tax=Homarus americanus TaxID=6706 RepID=UPI001C43991C|nr:isatin hydrolase-like isoform X2 [Homarus americanus]